MPPLPTENTGRFWLAYNDSINNHEMMVRFTSAASLAVVMDYVDQYLAAQDTILYDWQVLSARYAGVGSLISTPIAWTGLAAYGAGTMPANQAPRELCYLGRTTGGRRFRTFLYGGNFTTPDDFRFPSVAASVVEAVLVVLNAASAAGVFVAIDNLRPTLYTYADVQYNSYWESQARI